MTGRRILVVALVAASVPALATAQSTTDEIVLSIEALQPPAQLLEETPEKTVVEILVPSSTEKFAAEFQVVVTSELEPCFSDPAECGENFTSVDDQGNKIYGCADGIDNDEDGVTDFNDPGCTGIQGWTLVVATDESLALFPDPNGTYVDGTMADDETRGGLVDVDGGFLRYQNVVDPDRNNGQNGVVAVCVFSIMEPVTVPPVSEAPALRLAGEFDASALAPGESSAPCLLEFRGLGQQGLAGFGDEVVTRFTVSGDSVHPSHRQLEVIVTKDFAPPFRRSDTNSDGSVDLSDGVAILSFLFLGHSAPECVASADTDDSGDLDLSDGIAIFNFLFLGAAPPAPPGPEDCGTDPTPDSLTCDAYSGGC